MGGVELLDEAEWLSHQGVHPEMVAFQLHVKPWSIVRMAQRHKRSYLIEQFKEYNKPIYKKRMSINAPRRFDEHSGLDLTDKGGQRFRSTTH